MLNCIRMSSLKKQICEIRQRRSSFLYLCVLEIVSLLRKEHCQKMTDDHTSKYTRLLYREIDVEGHIQYMSLL